MVKKTPKKVDQLSGKKNAQKAWITWQAPEFTAYEKGKMWSVALIAGAIALEVLFFLLKDYSAMLVVLAGAIALYRYAHHKPRTLQFSVSNEGVTIGNKSLDWETIKGFWLNAEETILYIETTKRPFSIESINVGNADPSALRQILLQHVPEQATRGEILSDRVNRWFKF